MKYQTLCLASLLALCSIIVTDSKSVKPNSFDSLIEVLTERKTYSQRYFDRIQYRAIDLTLLFARRANRGYSSACQRGTKLSHAVALKICQAAGIGIKSSTGRIGCRDVGCTSLEQVRCDTVLGIVAFKKASGCSEVVITGGTEKGHASGTYSHYNGYKLDISLSACINGYIKANYRYGGKRPDGADMYIDGRGNVYALENNHWDIVYYK